MPADERLAAGIHPQLYILDVIVPIEPTHHGMDAHAVECRER